MATPPTFVNSYQSAWNSNTTPKTASVTTQAGDVVVVCGVSENETAGFTTISGNSISFTQQQFIQTSGYTTAIVWTGTDAAGGTSWTLSVANNSSTNFGFVCYVFRGSGGIGASNKNNASSGTAPSVGLTTTQDNSAIVTIAGDWLAGTGSSRTWLTINSITPTAGNNLERAYYDGSTPGTYTVYSAYWNDAGTAGAKTVGMSAPNQKYSIIAIEVKGNATVPPMPLMWIGM